MAASGAGRPSVRTHSPGLQGSEQKHHLGARGGQWRNGSDQGPKQASPGRVRDSTQGHESCRVKATWCKVSVRVLQGSGQRMAAAGGPQTSGCLMEDGQPRKHSQGLLPGQEWYREQQVGGALGWASRPGPRGSTRPGFYSHQSSW